jgi:hypothetical protein
MIRLFIEGQELDVNEGFTHQITYAVDDIKNIDSKATAFSKTIVLPGTANNNKLLGNIFEFGNANLTQDGAPNVGYNFNASKSAKILVEINGLIILKGVLRLMEIVIDGENIEYEIALFGELGGFVSKLGNSKLENLDFSAYNHTYTGTNIVNSWDTVNGSGYFYPLIDYGLVSTYKHNFYYRAFRPALYVKEYMEKIITDAGFTYESNFFNTNFFKRLIIPNNDNGFLKKDTTDYVNGNNNTTDTYSYTGVQSEPNFKTWEQVFQDVGSLISFNRIGGVYTYTGDGTSVKITSLIKYDNTANNSLVRVYLYKQRGTVKTRLATLVPASGISEGVISAITDIIANDDLYVEIYIAKPLIGQTTTFKVLADSTIKISKEPAGWVEYSLGNTINISNTIPSNILQKDFFASILKMFNLMVTEDKYKENHLIIEPWVDFYDLDSSTYLDWSEKMDRSEAIRVKPMSEINARFYEFKFKSDSDYYNEKYKKRFNEGYGDRKFDNQLDFAKETTSSEVIFASTPLVGYDLEDKIVPTIFKWDGLINVEGEAISRKEEQVGSVIRIMQAKKITDVSSWKITTGYIGEGELSAISGGNNLTTYGYAGHLDDPDAPGADLNFGATQELYFNLATGALSNNMFNAYYSSYMAEITDKDSRLLTAKFKLTEKDIFNLDFGKFIWIDGVLYRLIKIYDYSEGELCKVDLLRVIYTTY